MLIDSLSNRIEVEFQAPSLTFEQRQFQFGDFGVRRQSEAATALWIGTHASGVLKHETWYARVWRAVLMSFAS